MNSFALSSAFIPTQISLPCRRITFSGVAFPSPPAVVTVRTAATPAKAAAEAGKRPPRGITKPKSVSPALQAVVGVKEIPRTQALKVIWAYIKEHNLQDPNDKKVIVCDEKLKGIFAGKDRVGFLEISGLLNPHFEK